MTGSLNRLMKLLEVERAATAKWMELFDKKKTSPACPRCRRELKADIPASVAESQKKGSFVILRVPCECVKQENLDWLKRLNVPTTLLHATFDNWNPESAQDTTRIARLREFAAKPAGFVVLLGGYGLGKSHLAVAILRTLRRGLFITQLELLERLRRTYRDDRAPDIVRRAQTTPLLVIDEMGIDTGARDEFPMIHSILSQRYNEKLPTVLTSNSSRDEFYECIGGRLRDRLAECIYAEITLTGKSKRPQRRDNYIA